MPVSSTSPTRPMRRARTIEETEGKKMHAVKNPTADLAAADLGAAARARRADVVKHITAVDLARVLSLIDEAGAVAEGVDELRTQVDDRQKSEQQAEIGRRLNRLADLLDAASAEAKMEYWRLKGFQDPRG